MFASTRIARVLVLTGAAVGGLSLLPAEAQAVSPYHWNAMMIDWRIRAYSQRQVGYGSVASGSSFGARHDWQALRAVRRGQPTAAVRNAAIQRSAQQRAPLRFRPTQRLGGLGRKLEAGAIAHGPPVRFDRIFTGASTQGAPTFSRIHEGGGAGSVSFGGLREGAASFEFGGLRR